uniref:FYN-binding protein 2 n=1 Tax=Jaculus jaculus TaxID=51337 RepID=UPI001E1B05EA|nr:FYN-binding protein 2 [Jaculus jaculus]
MFILATYEVGIQELQKPWKTCLHQELSHGREDEENPFKEVELCEQAPQKPEEDSCCRAPHVQAGIHEETARKFQMTGVPQDRRSTAAGNQDSRMDISQNKVFPENRKLPRHCQDQGGYVQALEVTKEAPHAATLRSSEDTYDDVECPRDDGPPGDVTCSLASESEENNEEMYEDIYKTKNSDGKTDSDGQAALQRLQRFFKREKGRFRIKTAKSKENVSNGFSTSLPDLGLGPRSRELTVYDDVGLSGKEWKYKEEDKLKIWKAKFLMPKGKNEQKNPDRLESFSPRNFFKTKKQNLEKNRMEREEKLFRERFQYNKEIRVINRAVVCSSDSSNGAFYLPITPGEHLDVIDTTEQNQVICRNSKGKYGFVLIEHVVLNIKSDQGSSKPA